MFSVSAGQGDFLSKSSSGLVYESASSRKSVAQGSRSSTVMASGTNVNVNT